jgi:hypothetical protein
MTALRALELLHTAVFAFGLLAGIFSIIVIIRGVAPVLWRLGNGLANRQIALFARGDNLSSLKLLLNNSHLLRSKNIIEVTSPKDIGAAAKATVFIVFWHDWASDIDEILAHKEDRCALIVYAPYDRDPIPTEQMIKLDGKRHTAVTNFRGRLLNDIITSMITTSE